MSKSTEWLKRAFGKSSADQSYIDDLVKPSSAPTRPELLGNTSLNTANNTLRSTLKVFLPYWTQASAKEKAIAYPMMIGAIAATVWQVDIMVQFSEWQSGFFDLFQNMFTTIKDNKDLLKEPGKIAQLPEMIAHTDKLLPMVKDFGAVIGKFMASVALSFSLAQFTAWRWRDWMTGKLTDDLLSNGAFYRISHMYRNVDNPEQRIQQDIDKATGGFISLATDGVGSALTLGTFSTLLWNMSGTFNTASIGLPAMEIQGLMFWIAAGYAAGWTGLTHMIGKPLVSLDRQQQMRDAFFRMDIKRTMDHSESIKLNDGADVEKKNLARSFFEVMDNSKKLILKRKQLILSRSLYGNMSIFVPYTASVPMILAGKIASFGALQKTAYYFGQVQSAFSWPIDNYQSLADLGATTIRLSGQIDAVDKSNADLDLKKKAGARETAPTELRL